LKDFIKNYGTKEEFEWQMTNDGNAAPGLSLWIEMIQRRRWSAYGGIPDILSSLQPIVR
jgi:hypothetical protein